MKRKLSLKNMRKTVAIIAGLLFLLTFAQCKKETPDTPIDNINNNGKVEIPAGMSNTDIIVTNFGEDAIPDENGDFAIGYSKMLVAKNAENGKIMYYTITSIDNDDRNSFSNYELSPKETAITLAIRMLPMIMGGGSDDVLEALKNVMYSLPSVQALEASIQNVINQYGYLKGEDLESAINNVKTFIYSELEISGKKGLGQKNHKIRIDKDGIGQKDLRAPYLPIDMMHGTKIDIQEDRTQYIASPEHWSINCIGYNGLPCSFGLVVGNADMNNIGPNGEVQFDYDEDGLMYFLPPTGLARALDIATLGDWEGLAQFFVDFAHLFTDIHYEPLFDKAKLENIDFDIYLSDNVMGFICSEDNERVEIVNIMYVAFDGVSAVLPALDNFFGSIVPQFIGDAQYMSMFHNEIHNGSEGLDKIYRETVVKLVTIGANMAEQGLLKWVGRQAGESLTQEVSDFLEAISGLGALTKIADAGLLGIGIDVVESFGLPIYADFNNNIALSITTIDPVGIHNAHVDARIIDAGLHPISEKGFCYSTSHNPGLDDNVVAGEYVSQSQFSCDLEGLEPNTTYYVRAYAKNNMELFGYSKEMSFKTLNGPTVTTLEASNITPTTAQVNAEVVYPNPSQPISYEKGFLYSTENGGLWYGSECEYAVYEGSSQNEFSCTLSNLEPYTTYYVKAYSKYENNLVAYGDVVSFYTDNYPTVTTHELLPSNIGSTSATVTGSVVFPDPTQPTEYERGFVLGESEFGLTVNSENMVLPFEGTALLNYSCTFSNLWPETQYHVRAYSYSPNGQVLYGNVVSFTTLPNSGPQTFIITATANPTNGGMVSGGGTYNQGQSCTVSATANTGYTFTNWTENGTAVSTDANYTFTVSSDRTLVANFTASGGGGGNHEYVDLGLPSGLLWATCNVGANAPEEYGDYFAWGETEPKADYNVNNYKYCNGNENALTKYCTDAGYGFNGFTDNLTTLLPEDDAATVNWGNNWHTPTEAEWQELLNNTSITWTIQNGVNGRLFTASNGNSLFMPAAGFNFESFYLGNYGGRYWSSSLELDNPSNAWNNSFYSGDCGIDSGRRAAGRTVRAVREN